MQALFAFALFAGAFLLFLVQPMVGKMLLPYWGGAPAVWNTCMVFFQVTLLAGYSYAHGVTRLSRRQLIVHAAVLALPVLILPIAVDASALDRASGGQPVFAMLVVLAMAVGLPFFVLSTTGPLLQKWFAETGHAAAGDPYFLYGASNTGSFMALIAYPALVEPRFSLAEQSRLWTWGFAAYAVMVVACACLFLRRSGRQRSVDAMPSRPAATAVSGRRIVRWVLLAFVPSSMLIGATNYITTDVAPIPLLWVVPLGLYLLTFVLVFAKRPWLPHSRLIRWLPIAAATLAIVLLTGATDLRSVPVATLIALHLIVFFIVAMVCHGELAADRPDPEKLTLFYFWMSLGGALGGMFNGLLAPVLFRRAGLSEYPLALVAACLLCPPHPLATLTRSTRAAVLDFALPVLLGGATIGIILLIQMLEMQMGPIRSAATYGIPLLAAYLFSDRPRRYGLALGALLLASALDAGALGKTLYRERNFFGVLRVTEFDDGPYRFRCLLHGNTIHGIQSLDRTAGDGRRWPAAYYHPSGPIGKVFSERVAKRAGSQRIAVIGLGTGSLAYYARPGDDWTFFEIDPGVARVATDPAMFSFMSECLAGPPRIVLGDARLRLRDIPDHGYDLIVLDAFSSDAIPTHLLTREALQLYRDKLAPNGLLAFHISNRYLDLRPVVGRLAEAAEPPMVCGAWYDTNDDETVGKKGSEWMVLANTEGDLGSLASGMWDRVTVPANTPLWTDDFTNLFGALRRMMPD